ncbi:MAG TPA: metallophosphoesterase [Alphaproteobacteria bacterium]|nr:metallophosphoesterase [Alphaproteobacteria bacterium]
MVANLTKRDFLRLAGLGGVVFASALPGFGLKALAAEADEFYFVQLSDLHWGFKGPAVNPDAEGTLPKAIAAVNALPEPPDFIVFTGDITHTTDDPKERRARMAKAKEIVAGLKVKTLYFLPGEHDASLDAGEAYKEFFGATHYAFDHKGVHFVALDNVSDPRAMLGKAQLDWLAADLKRLKPETPVVVFTHRPLFDLAPSWDWATPDGQAAIDLLTAHAHAIVFYGHIHQENFHMTGPIAHHAAKGLMFPLPAPLSVPKKAPIPWDPAMPYKGLGWRDIEADAGAATFEIVEYPVVKA